MQEKIEKAIEFLNDARENEGDIRYRLGFDFVIEVLEDIKQAVLILPTRYICCDQDMEKIGFDQGFDLYMCMLCGEKIYE